MPAQLDVIIPVYNEADNVRPLVERLNKALSEARISYHLIFVDDRSSDDTVDTLTDLAKEYPIQLLHKKGKQGKAYSILEGAKASKAPLLAMIDADLQYPPEVIPAMLELTADHGVVVAKRNSYQDSKVRRTMSRTFQWVFGKLLHGLDCDVQSGLKVFKREIIENVDREDVTAWTLDIPLLTTALGLGYSIGQIDITFEKRNSGESKIQFVSSIREIGGQAVTYKFKRKKPRTISPDNKGSMIGAGLVHKGKRFVTHTTLHPDNSALEVLSFNQMLGLCAFLVALLICFVLQPLGTAKVLVGILSFIYFIDVVFNFFLILKSLHMPPEISVTAAEIKALKDKELPIYTVLCPLYKEAHVIPQFVEAIELMVWPKKKLDVQLLLEQDDVESIAAAKKMKLPSYVRIVVVPDSQPKTKPKACNYGLSLAKGDYVVIYDAEDKPDPLQLKKSYLAFQKVGPNIKCLQAKLNYYNPNQNWLTRLFTAEYSLWFDVILTGLQSIETTIPLGGTSNHFRTADLMTMQGWDPFNVTEDCDLGVRLFNQGFKTAIIDSTTLEEANSNFHNWLRQRSRWIKGYMQTYLLHMRNPVELARRQGIHALLFQLTVGGKISFILINPVLWVLTISYFVLYKFVGPGIEALYPSIIFYMAVTSLVFGNFMFIYYYMIGCAKREHWGLMKWIYLIPLYWLMVSISGFIAFYELIVKPHYWQKTVHGLHLKKQLEKDVDAATSDVVASVIAEVEVKKKTMRKLPFSALFERIRVFANVRDKVNAQVIQKLIKKLKNPEYRSGIIYVVAAMVANLLNMLTNLYTGNELKFVDFAIFNTYSSLLYLIGIPLGALSVTMNHHTAKLLGKYNITSAQAFWRSKTKRSLMVAALWTIIWIVCMPYLKEFFHFDNFLPLILFTPLIIIGIVNSVSSGYVGGRLLFAAAGISAVTEALVRLIATMVIGELAPNFIYLSLPISGLIGFAITFAYAARGEDHRITVKEYTLPKTFFSLAFLMRLSAIAFFSLDNIFVAHYLTAQDTGKYGILGLVGKMIFFAGSLTIGFILPVVSRLEGKGQSSKHVFLRLTAITAATSVAAYLALGLALPVAAPYFFGEKLNAISGFLPVYCLGILFYTIAQAVLQYHLAKRHYSFAIVSFVLAILQVSGLAFFHASLWQVVLVMCLSGTLNCIILFLMHFFYDDLAFIRFNLQDFWGIFERFPNFAKKKETSKNQRMSILFFNWRDTKHVWAGGAEAYIQELAEKWVKKGINVTIFCGSDEKSPRNEVVNGVQIVRRGGFYTVYFWAFIYYILKFRGLFDVIVDSENGVPFFSPLYAGVPVFLLIHHIHQDVFRTNLMFPLAQIANFAEGKVMPFVYRNSHIVTVSESSKQDLLKLIMMEKPNIHIVNPGVHLPDSSIQAKKTKFPSICYIGRLKKYKNVDLAIHAFQNVLKKKPDAKFYIAGDGDAKGTIQRLVKSLKLEKSVILLGKVSEVEKISLLMSSWVMIQPSSFEGWGMTVIEANVCGTPVIASNVIGLRDSVVDGRTGVLFAEKNMEELERAIMKMFTSEATRKLYSKNAKAWSQDFAWDKEAEKFLRIIEEGLAENPESQYAMAYASIDPQE